MQATHNPPQSALVPIAPMQINADSGEIVGSGELEELTVHLDKHDPVLFLDRSGLNKTVISGLVLRRQAFHLDEPELLDKLDNPTFPLNTPLQALLAASAQSLKSDASQANAEKVILEMLEKVSLLLEQNVVVLAYNTELSSTRQLVFRVYHRLAKILGRNTVEAVRADTKAMLAAASGRLSYTIPRGRKPKTYSPSNDSELDGPELHIEDVIEPILDQDMKTFAYSISTYSEPLKKFYNVLAQWKSDNKLKRVG